MAIYEGSRVYRTGRAAPDLRRYNRALVLGLVRELGPISRADLGREGRLSMPAVMEITDVLIGEGLIREIGRGPSTGGRPPLLLGLVSDAYCAISVEVGTRTLTTVVTNLNANVEFRSQVPSLIKEGPNKLLEQLKTSLREAFDHVPSGTGRHLGIGLALPAPILLSEGVFFSPPSFPGWGRLLLGDMVAEDYGFQVVVDNDANAAALGEYLFGAGRKADAASRAPGNDLARQTLHRYAEGTWASFEAMTDPNTGLPAGTLREDGEWSVKTSITNIGAYIWSTVVAEELGIIGHDEAVARLDRTLTTLEGMERHEPSGQFYNWYDIRNGDKLTQWPETGEPYTPWLSSVDNGWLATSLQIVRNTTPELSGRAGKLYDSMDFGFYYRPEANRILFHYAPVSGAAPCCYDTIVSESRIASYIGIGKGEIPQRHHFGAYRGMFEALMPALFVPEERWAPESWRINHPRTVRAQIHHGLQEAGYGYWGFSPANVPEGGYSVYGVDAVGMDPNGNPSNNDRTLVDHGFSGCPDREPQPDPPSSAYTNGVVIPHAAFLALRYAPDAALENLNKLEQDFDGLYTPWGFRDSVNVDSGVVSDYYLSLDQGMIMASIGNALADDMLRNAFVTKGFQQRVKPVMQVEEFNVSSGRWR